MRKQMELLKHHPGTEPQLPQRFLMRVTEFLDTVRQFLPLSRAQRPLVLQRCPLDM